MLDLSLKIVLLVNEQSLFFTHNYVTFVFIFTCDKSNKYEASYHLTKARNKLLQSKKTCIGFLTWQDNVVCK